MGKVVKKVQWSDLNWLIKLGLISGFVYLGSSLVFVLYWTFII